MCHRRVKSASPRGKACGAARAYGRRLEDEFRLGGKDQSAEPWLTGASASARPQRVLCADLLAKRL